MRNTTLKKTRIIFERIFGVFPFSVIHIKKAKLKTPHEKIIRYKNGKKIITASQSLFRNYGLDSTMGDLSQRASIFLLVVRFSY